MAGDAWSDRWRPVVAMLAVNVALGTMNSLIKKAIDEGVSCLAIITLRQLVATIFMIPIACCRERGGRPRLTPGMFTRLFFCALLGATLTQYLFFVGMRETSATFACAFLNMTPVITFVVALVFRMEMLDLKSKAGQAKVVGTVVCVGGAMVLTFYKGVALTHGGNLGPLATSPAPAPPHAVEGTGRWTVGSVALFCACVTWCSWFFLQSNVNKKYPALYSCTAIIFFLSFLQSAVMTLVIEGGTSLLAVRGKLPIITIVFAQERPVFPAAFTPVIQIVVAIIDLSFMHERLHLGSVLGSVFVILGLYSLLWGKNKEIPSVCEIEVKHPEGSEENRKAQEPVEAPFRLHLYHGV
ncbi:unnamed protein product [Spirodela intermedia]|uniref:WAT1-related protein n=1 Tax=Spirodela intermedia TaxID=51605 RepID=A0A7I8J9V0_SPIIN|nr:unnamed protein product [Spirodela intermedia]CAA6666927.1 unnamed protein product [Spirodela intermedia]